MNIKNYFHYKGERKRHIAFPLGGIGAGGFAISGDGRFVDWSLNNAPGFGNYNGFSHLAIKAVSNGELVDARILNGPYNDNATGDLIAEDFNGFGHGARRESLVGLPHFENTDFIGTFPIAKINFGDTRFPGAISMQAYSPFIPHDSRHSSLPVAILEVEVENTTTKTLEYTLAASLGNLGLTNTKHQHHREEGVSSLLITSSGDGKRQSTIGDFAISMAGENIQHQEYWFRGQWFDDITTFWKDFAQSGPLSPRSYDTQREIESIIKTKEHGTLAGSFHLEPRMKKRIVVLISWNFPIGRHRLARSRKQLL